MLETAHSFWTLVMMLIFVGIVVWAWSSRRREDFDKAARSVLDDSQPAGEEKRDG